MWEQEGISLPVHLLLQVGLLILMQASMQVLACILLKPVAILIYVCCEIATHGNAVVGQLVALKVLCQPTLVNMKTESHDVQNITVLIGSCRWLLLKQRPRLLKRR